MPDFFRCVRQIPLTWAMFDAEICVSGE